MKARHILLLCSLAAAPQLATADAADTSPESLGMVRAVLQFCMRADPQDLPTFNAEWRSIVEGTSAKALDGVEDKSAYKRGHDLVTDLLEKMPKSEAARTCAAGAAQWNGGAAPKRDDPAKGGKTTGRKRTS